jgi:hypothetical protein
MPADTASPRPARARASEASASDAISSVTNEATETLKRTHESLNQVASECAAICSDDMAAAIETSTRSIKFLTEMTQSYLDACTQSAAHWAEIGRESLACRTPADFINLQKRAIDSLNTSFEERGKLYQGLYESWSKSIDPFVARVADGPQRLFRTFAD